MPETKYPLHEKLKAHEHESHVLSGFLDMLDERELVLASYHLHGDDCLDEDGELDDTVCGLNEVNLYTFGVPTKAELIGFYLEIDPKALSAEKEAMYAELVANNERREKATA